MRFRSKLLKSKLSTSLFKSNKSTFDSLHKQGPFNQFKPPKKSPLFQPTLAIVDQTDKRKNKVTQFTPDFDAHLQKRIDHAAMKVQMSQGAWLWDEQSDALNEFKQTMIEANYRQGVKDKGKFGKITGVYGAGSGNTLEQAINKGKRLPDTGLSPMDGSIVSIEGGSWTDNAHQLFGTGVGGTQQQRDIAYTLGLTQDDKPTMVVHSQANLTVENVLTDLGAENKELRNSKVVGIGSPLPKGPGPNSKRVTGMLDPIRLTRLVTGAVFGMFGSDKQIMVPGGHDSDEYLKNMPNSDELFGMKREKE